MLNKFLVFSLLMSFVHQQQHSKNDISVIEFSSYSVAYHQGKAIPIKNNIEIAYYKDYLLYKTTLLLLNHVADTSIHTVIDLTDTSGVEVHKYYVVKKGDSRGLVYDNLNKKKEFNYSELLKHEGLRREDNPMFAVDLGKPAQIERNKFTNDIEVERFENRFKGKHEPDSIYRYYSKDLVDIDFSFNPSIDQKMKNKFCKFLLVYHTKSNANEKNAALARRETYWQFKKIKSKDTLLFQKYFDDFIIEREKIDLK